MSQSNAAKVVDLVTSNVVRNPVKTRCAGSPLFLFLLLFGGVRAQAQHQRWYTREVSRELGRAPCDNCVLGRGDEKSVELGASRITAVTMFYFDTVATYARGRVVDKLTGKPIGGAVIQVSYTCWESGEVKSVTTDQAGFFCLGWVGCHGLKGGRSNRPLQIRAAGYPPISTEAVNFGGGTYLHIELADSEKRRR